jgi:hypothetical protein
MLTEQQQAERLQAIAEGEAARREGIDRTVNPYLRGAPSHQWLWGSWLRGWEQADLTLRTEARREHWRYVEKGAR